MKRIRPHHPQPDPENVSAADGRILTVHDGWILLSPVKPP